MNITPVNYNVNNNINNNYNRQLHNGSQVSFGTSAAKVAGTVQNSKLFEPLQKGYAKVVDFIRENYHKKIINSKATKWILDKTEGNSKTTTHMMVAGSTLISGMYVGRTLTNEKLDKEKRKTLALNDLMTWGISTFLTYKLDDALNNKWEGVTRRFAAGYIKKYTDPKYIEKFEAEQAKIKADCLAKGKEYVAPDFNPRELAEKCKAKGIVPEHLNKNIQDAMDNVAYENYLIKLKNEAIKAKNAMLPAGAVPEKLIDTLPPIKSVKDFNVEVLQFGPLTSKLKGMNTLKSIFVFATVYRYLVPVLVMKPANMLGNYIHKKQAEKEQLSKQA